jgi:cytochrome c2
MKDRKFNFIFIARSFWLFLFVSVASLSVLAPRANGALPQNSKPSKSSTKVGSDSNDDSEAGQKKFQANCSRCHDAPEQFSPRIAGTIVRHMRVRASLSAQDEKDILKFLAP